MKIAYTVLSLLLAIILIMGLSYNQVQRDLRYATSIKTEQTRSMENVLTNWVYSKSSRISLNTARLITQEVMKTDRPLLMLALICVESEFVPSATSNKGAVGLMQVMWEPHKKILIETKVVKEKRDLYNTDVSIKAGNLLLNNFLKETSGDLGKALERYLGGKDGYYVGRILNNLGNLYILTGEEKIR